MPTCSPRRPAGRALLAAAALALLGASTPQDHHPEWLPYHPVEWADFRGPAPREPGALAKIYTGILFDGYDLEVTVEGGGWRATVREVRIHSYMDRSRSGVRRLGRKPAVLAHEQAHFDLTEYHVRRLRSRLRGVDAHGATAAEAEQALAARVAELHEETLAAWREVERRYDVETRNGASARMQRKWLRRVAAMMAEYEAAPR